MPRNVPNTANKKNKKKQAEGRCSADTDTSTHFKWVKSDDQEGLFLHECWVFFGKILHIVPLNESNQKETIHVKAEEKFIVR